MAERDLHVVSLRYVLQPNERISFEKPSRKEFETAEAKFSLDSGILSCEMKIHFSDATAARGVVDPMLQAWEAAADLTCGLGALRFRFDYAEVIDRSPVPQGDVVVVAKSAHMFSGSAPVRVTVSCSEYPDPQKGFKLNPNVETLLHRYRGYVEGKEPLLAMAYFCLTVIESTIPATSKPKRRTKGGQRRRDRAARALGIEVDILDIIGELSSEHGIGGIARKASAHKPLTSSEVKWLEKAISMVILRLGMPEASPPLTMTDIACNP